MNRDTINFCDSTIELYSCRSGKFEEQTGFAKTAKEETPFLRKCEIAIIHITSADRTQIIKVK